MTPFGYFTGGIPIALSPTHATLTSDLVFTTRDGMVHTVPAGFHYDGASIPRQAWSIIGHPFTGAFIRPAALHDWYCVHKSIQSSAAHRLLYDGLRSEGVGWFRAQLMYRAVQVFGPRFTPK